MSWLASKSAELLCILIVFQVSLSMGKIFEIALQVFNHHHVHVCLMLLFFPTDPPFVLPVLHTDTYQHFNKP